jgi:acyl phosphate:glycerol-3-phosphate acyltransferase
MGYLLGSVPVAALVARRHGVDLYTTGDRNPGAWNALEQLGPRRALPAFLGDGLKGLLAGAVGWLLGDFWTAYTGVAAAMAGHAFPVFARFRGGKSVMAFVGGGFALAPLAALAALGACALVTAATSFKWGARAGVFGFPALQLALYPVDEVIATGSLMAFIGVLFGVAYVRPRHRRVGRSADHVKRTATAGSASGESQNGAPRHA